MVLLETLLFIEISFRDFISILAILSIMVWRFSTYCTTNRKTTVSFISIEIYIHFFHIRQEKIDFGKGMEDT
jgi:hypothetical protein